MATKETAPQAWKRIMGTTYDYSRPECRWFLTGFNAGSGRA